MFYYTMMHTTVLNLNIEQVLKIYNFYCKCMSDILCCPFTNLNMHHVIDCVSYFMYNITVCFCHRYFIIHI